MALFDDIKQLAKLQRSPSPFLTMYLNTRWHNEKQRERVRIFVKTKLKECLASNSRLPAAARQGIEEDAEKVEHYARGVVSREWDEIYHGIAVFACSSFGVYRLVRSHLPFADSFVCSDRPVLRPVVEHAHAGEPAVLALVAGDGGRLVEFELGGVRREFLFEDTEFPGRHEQGGWSQARYQRHIDEHIHRNLKRLSEHLVKWLDERRVNRVALSGPAALVASFEEHLPRRVHPLICARIHVDPKATQDVIQNEALEALREARRRDDLKAVDSLLNKGVGTGRVVTGPEAVAGAVAAGKVHELQLDLGFREPGWKCFGCRALGVRVPLGCDVCGASIEGVELGEEFIRGTLAMDGTVLIVDGHDGLWEERGVAALLRY
jgi:peptide chain release factor subunit 1